LTRNDFNSLINLFNKSFPFDKNIKEIVTKAMIDIDRAIFVPDNLKDEAYFNNALPTYCGQTISQPQIVFEMSCLLEPQKESKILEIGTGVGYQTAILAYISKEIISIERIEKLHQIAKNNLSKLNFNNVELLLRNGSRGYENRKPYDRILITASIKKDYIDIIKNQLNDNGILIAPLEINFGLQQLIKIKKVNDKYFEEYHSYCVFVPIIDKAPE
jgi:protein-L-isoaspartate(D-aspartate) O-methyltransferase